MRSRSLLISVALAVVSTITLIESQPSLAQQPKSNPKLLGMDSIKTNKHQLFGFVLGRRADGTLECAVDRLWLETTYPDYAAEVYQRESTAQSNSKLERVERVKAWIAERSDDQYLRLRLFLEDELDKLHSLPAVAEKTTFVWLNIPPAELIKVVLANPALKHLAGVAYKHELPDITISPAPLLERKLKEKGIDPPKETFDLTTKLPKLVSESAQQWAARQAIIEHDILKPVELQGTGSMLQGADDAIDALAIFGELAGGQQSELLQQLSKELKLNLVDVPARPQQDPWRRKAIDKAEKLSARAVLVHRMQQDLFSGNSKINTSFLAKSEDGQWFEVYESEASNDGSHANAAEMERLKKDPTLKGLLPMVEALGGADALERALRQGAGTSSALAEARQKFRQFSQPYSTSLLTPPVPLKEPLKR
jgi:hypothetical protein